ncbi:hypothetical protein Q7P35_009859 [Cladosporium inversicolor]
MSPEVRRLGRVLADVMPNDTAGGKRVSVFVGPDTVEVHSNNREDFFYVHEDLLRKQFGKYDLMIDEAVETTGEASK